MFFCIPLTLVP